MASFRFAVLARRSCFTDCVMVLFFIIDNWWKQGLSLLETLDQMSFREKIPCTRNFGWITPQKFGWKITKLPQNSHLVHAFNSVNRDSLVSIILNQFLERFHAWTVFQKQLQIKTDTKVNLSVQQINLSPPYDFRLILQAKSSSY